MDSLSKEPYDMGGHTEPNRGPASIPLTESLKGGLNNFTMYVPHNSLPPDPIDSPRTFG